MDRHEIHTQLVCGVSRRSNPSERAWSQVLRDSDWWGEDPATCKCGAPALHKRAGCGYCRAHYSEAQIAAQRDSNALLGRYDRARRFLNMGRSLVSHALPKKALAESVALADVRPLEAR